MWPDHVRQEGFNKKELNLNILDNVAVLIFQCITSVEACYCRKKGLHKLFFVHKNLRMQNCFRQKSVHMGNLAHRIADMHIIK